MNDRCYQSQIDAGASEEGQRCALVVLLVINAATFLMLITAAGFSGSSSLLASALDNFDDVVTYAVSLAVS